jgi:hypothetical protein
MHFPSAVSLIAGLICTSSLAFAASNVDLTVKGSITPNACDTMISNGGVVDHGKLTARDLSADAYTLLPIQPLLLSVRCEGPTLFTFNMIDNRTGSSAVHGSLHGLGLINDNEKLGSAAFSLTSPVADSVAVRTIMSTNGGASWAAATYLGHAALTAIASADDTSQPIAVKDFDAGINVSTMIARADGLTLTDEVPIDGHVTLQLTYL